MKCCNHLLAREWQVYIVAHKGLDCHLEQTFEYVILYTFNAVAIFSLCHPYIWSTTVFLD